MKTNNMRGLINVGCIFLVLLGLAGVYLGYSFGKVYVAKYMLNRRIFQIAGDVAEDIERKMFPTDSDIANAILQEAESLSADITLEDIYIARDDLKVDIKATWEDEVVIPFYTHFFCFEFEASRNVVY